MKAGLRLLSFLAFAGTACVAALAVSGIGRPSMAGSLLGVALVASLAGAPGLVSRRAAPASLLLIPLGAYLIMRLQLPVRASPIDVAGQAGFYVRHLLAGEQIIATDPLPLQLEGAADVRLLIALSLYAAAALAALLALGLRRPAAGIAVTVVVLGVGLTADDVSRVVWLPLAYVFLAACTLLLSRSLERPRWGVRDAAIGAATAAAALVAAAALLGATSTSESAPWTHWRSWGVPGHGAAPVSIDWTACRPGVVDIRSNTPVMQVRSPVATYWRANALEEFDGTEWTVDPASRPLGAPRRDDRRFTYLVPPTEPTPAGRTVTEVFDLRALSTEFYFTGGAPAELSLDSPGLVRTNGAQALWLTATLSRDSRYTVTAVVPRLRPSDLVGRERRYSMGTMRLLALPFPRAVWFAGSEPGAQWRRRMNADPADREWLGLYALNRTIVGTATDPYEITLRIEEYLRSHYAYSATPPRTAYRSPFAAFLLSTKTGYCQHFAGAMAVLLRFNGVPARVALGFKTGTQRSPGVYLVRAKDAHAWVEAYFSGVGWVAFDPTPGNVLPGSGPSSTTAGFIDPYSGLASTERPVLPASAPAVAQGARDGRASGPAPEQPAGAGRLLWLLVPAGVVALWPCARGTLRRERLRHGTLDQRLRASLRLVRAELRDFGVATPPSQTLRDLSWLVRDHLALDASALARRVEAVLYGGRAATREDLRELARLDRDVRRRLRAKAGWGRALLAAYGLMAPARTSGRSTSSRRTPAPLAPSPAAPANDRQHLPA
jgi:protein-glutamine gamma-glutamyltransferase